MKKFKLKLNRKTKRILAAVVPILIFAHGACNEVTYVPLKTEESIESPGSYSISPKVDLLFVQDNSGSMRETKRAMADQLPKFLNELVNKNWDFHLAVVPLVSKRPITEVAASQYDPNWKDEWKSPFPGAADQLNAGLHAGKPIDEILAGTIQTEVFRKPYDFGGFMNGSDFDSNAGDEPGLENLVWSLESGAGSTNFMRSDALLAVLIVGNGNDTSGVNYETRADGYTIVKNDGSATASFNQYLSRLKGLKKDPSQVKVFAAVSPTQVASPGCLGSSAYAGTRYLQLASATGGKAYNICKTPVATLLAQLTRDLSAQNLNYTKRFFAIQKEPDLDTVKVTKYLGGDTSRPVELSQNGSNGWTYYGAVSPNSPVNMIESPIQMGPISGQVIELHGSAKLVGNDTLSISYMPKGYKTSTTGK